MGMRVKGFGGTVITWLLLCGAALPVKATNLPVGFTEANWANSIASNCTAMAFAPDGRLFVCQQNGHLRVIDASGTLLGPDFVTLTVDSSGERGLLGVAFDPSFSSNHFVYVYHTVPAGPSNVPPPHNQITRYTANGNVATGAGTNILDLDNLSSATNHNGGAIHFGPDGKLYVAVGDNASGTNPANSNSQKVTNRLGKILRINADPISPTPNDNPATFTIYDGSTVTPTGANRQIWTIGLRNPFTFGFQPGTTRMFINDVGEGTWEEINDGLAGKNYGWPSSEGPDNLTANFTGPLYYYNHNTGSPTGCAIVGGAFYNPSVLQFPASYVGKYFFGDLCGGFIYLMNPANNTASAFATAISGSLVDLKVGVDGALYYLVQSGQVKRVQATPSQAVNISTRARIETGEDVLIGGFIITGSGTKNVIIRGLGPSLPASVPNRMADPVLELHGPPPTNTLLASNDNWRVPVQNQTAVQATGLQPGNDLEPAIVASLQPGGYTAIMSGQNNSVGSGLIEVYDLNTGASSQLGNVSSRGFVQTVDNVMIGGFIIGKNIGATKVIVRALGPSLSGAGVANPLPDPTLELRDSNGTTIRFDNDWQDDPTQAAQITATGLQPPNTLESAIFAALAPGGYTAIVAGNNSGTGVGLVEVYKIP
jgi:glucose/arabinose dehydrogenase